jgi:hypothetical protein
MVHGTKREHFKSISAPHQAPPRVTKTHTPSRPPGTPKARRCSRCNSLSHLPAQINLPAEPPAQSTRSKVRAADDRQRVTRLRQPTQSSIRKTRQANAITTKTNWQRILRKVERDVEQAMAVMDRDFRQDDELTPANETSQIQQSMNKII